MTETRTGESHAGAFVSTKGIKEWRRFQETQSSKYASRTGPMVTEDEANKTGWRITVKSAETMPGASDRSFYQMKFGLTLFDNESKTFFGKTAISDSYSPISQNSKLTANMNKSFYFWSQMDVKKCFLVFEIIKVKGESLEESMGWASISLDIVAKATEEQACDVIAGSPRILLFGGPTTAKPSKTCTMIYKIERTFDRFANDCHELVPEFCFVDSRDLIPGCRRFDMAGREVTTVAKYITPIEHPRLAPKRLLQVCL